MEQTLNKKLLHPLFILSIILLMLNDFYLKQEYANAFTGKLSDFAGLFAFPFFFSCLFPDRKKIIHILTCILFVWWKSLLSQPFIGFVNGFGIPMTRVIDFTDNMALFSVGHSYFVFSKDFDRKSFRPAYQFLVVIVAFFSFTATSMAPRMVINYASVNKTYRYDMPIEEFVSRYNQLMKTGYIYRECGYNDTINKLINLQNYSMNDTIEAGNCMTHIQIYRINDSITELKLVDAGVSVNQNKIKDFDSAQIVENRYNDRDYIRIRYYTTIPADTINENKLQDKAIKEFEKKIVKKLK